MHRDSIHSEYNLSHCCGTTFVHQEIVLISDDEVKINYFVSKGGELVAEAEAVLALLRRRPRERVVLLLRFFVENLLRWRYKFKIDVVLASADYLKVNTSGVKSISITRRPAASQQPYLTPVYPYMSKPSVLNPI